MVHLRFTKLLWCPLQVGKIIPFAGSCLGTSKLTITEPAAILPLDTSAQMRSRLRLRHNQVSTFVGQDQVNIFRKNHAKP